jgi:hypothetical protein
VAAKDGRVKREQAVGAQRVVLHGKGVYIGSACVRALQANRPHRRPFLKIN